MNTIKKSQVAINTEIAQKYGMTLEQYEAMQAEIKQTTQSEAAKAKEQREAKKQESEATKEHAKQQRNVLSIISDERKEIRSEAQKDYQKISTVFTSIKKQIKAIESRNKEYNRILKADATIQSKDKVYKPESLILNSVVKLDGFSLSLISGNFTASEMKAIIKGCGKHTVRLVESSLYKIAAKIEISKLNGSIYDSQTDYDNGKLFESLIEPYAAKHAELNERKLNDSKQVRLVVAQYESKKISEAEKNERLAKYMTAEKMQFELNILLGVQLHKAFKAIKPALTAAQFDNYAAFYPDLNFLQSLVKVDKKKQEIEQRAKEMQSEANFVEVAELVAQ
jgi:hypothetical protein